MTLDRASTGQGRDRVNATFTIATETTVEFVDVPISFVLATNPGPIQANLRYANATSIAKNIGGRGEDVGTFNATIGGPTSL